MWEGPPFSTPSPAFIVCKLFDSSLLFGLRWYLIVVLICISLIMSDVEYLFKLELSSFSDIYPRMGLLDHMVVLFLAF